MSLQNAAYPPFICRETVQHRVGVLIKFTDSQPLMPNRFYDTAWDANAAERKLMIL